MEQQLLIVMEEEYNALKQLLNLLELQFSFILKRDIFSLDKVVEDIKLCNKSIAEAEVNRRRLTKGKAMREILKDLGSSELKSVFKSIENLLEGIRLQKETNELIIKQNLTFTNKMLSYLNPNRNVVTYDSYGKSKR